MIYRTLNLGTKFIPQRFGGSVGLNHIHGLVYVREGMASAMVPETIENGSSWSARKTAPRVFVLLMKGLRATWEWM